ncbi:hypothetical protein [Clostridium formicaceticum]|uniref:Uncharacterized protein n=1 Tax=Clostridium formicaceticum TaxID=1497 RepID=A0AAC9RKY0_9CLOT|nr:hypothetical protein [Clostridium formicaceticum]ARE86918.1 hypothetical protein CLFO_13020 [Clostridium formicaceticum]
MNYRCGPLTLEACIYRSSKNEVEQGKIGLRGYKDECSTGEESIKR